METPKTKILIVEDEPNMLKVLRALLASQGYEVLTATNGEEALKQLRASPCAVTLTDIRMPGMDGMALLERARMWFPQMPVIMLTAHGSLGGAVEAIKKGAFDYLAKPFEQVELIAIVGKAVAAFQQSQGHWIEAPEALASGMILGNSPRIREVLTLVEKVADKPSTVLLTGESGTGKNLVADLIQLKSGRHDQPYIKVNCAAVPEKLFESEFFGYEKGAFTGAAGSKPGRFELAHQGTLYLDEIAELPVEMQVKLLQVIQEKKFLRLGGVKNIEVDFRLIAATNRDLKAELAAGRFRQDLFYRLNVFPLYLPPLRERREDIEQLSYYFLHKFSSRLSKTTPRIAADALAALLKYDFPGNIRELENIMERALLIADEEEIEVSDLPPELCEAVEEEDAAPRPAGELRDKALPLKDYIRRKTAQLEKDVIFSALKKFGGNVTHTANYLQISRKALQLKMKEYEINSAAIKKTDD